MKSSPRRRNSFYLILAVLAGAVFFCGLFFMHARIHGVAFSLNYYRFAFPAGAVSGLLLFLLYKHIKWKYILKIFREEQKKTQTYLDVAGNILVEVGRDQTVRMINEKGLEVIGVSMPEIYGKNWYDFVVPEEIREVRKLQHERIMGGDEEEAAALIKNQPYKREILTKSGRRTIIWNGAFNRDKDGKIISIIASGQDITGLSQAEEALKELEKFPNVDPNPVLRINGNGNFLYSNLAGLSLIAKWRNEATGARINEWVEIIRTVINTESYSEREIKLGDEVFALTIVPVKEFQHAIVYARDITGRYKIAEELQKSEARLRKVLDLMPHMICAKDWEGRFILANRVIAEGYGMTPDELIGRKQIDIHTDKKDAERRMQTDRQVIATGQPLFIADDWCLSPDGERRDIETTKLPFEYDGKNLALTLGIDITERKKAEEAIREARNRAENYLDIAEVMLAALDTAGDITLINKKGAETLGYKQEELVGKNWFELLIPDAIRAEIIAVFRRLMAGETEQYSSHENLLTCKSGEERLFAFHNTITKNPSGEITGILFSAEDITDRKQMETRLIQTEKMQAIGQLAGGIAHDFNNQLAGIIGYADLLHSRLEDQKLKHYASQVLTSSRRAADLTAQLLAFSRKGRYLSVVVDLNKLVAEVISLLRHGIDKRIEIKKKLSPEPMLTLGDPTQLQNIILNVAINARDAMPNGGEIVFTTEAVELDEYHCRAHAYKLTPGAYVLLAIKDTGIGMDKETSRRIFEPFFTTKRVGEGVGMGLAAAYGAITSHQGAINVYSELNRGTVFKIYLPAAEAKESPSHPAREVLLKAETPARILLVDDEETVRESTTEVLEEIGYQVISFKNGKEALAYYATSGKDIDLVILDIVMPEMGGYETLTAMQEFNPEVRAILSSGYSIDRKVQPFRDNNAVDFIQKPFTASKLSQCIAKLLQTVKP